MNRIPDADELQWYIPASIRPSELQDCLTVINQFLENPLDLGGKKATQMLSRKARRRKRRAVSDDEEDEDEDDGHVYPMQAYPQCREARTSIQR